MIFCDKESFDMIKRLRAGKPATYIVTTLEELHVWQYHGRFYWKSVPEQFAYEYQDVHVVWNEKSYFVRRAIESNPYESDMFFWCDAGCFRGEGANGASMMTLSDRIEWPDLQVCRRLPQDKAIVMRASRAGERTYIRATFFGGAARPMLRWSDAFYQYLAARADGDLPLLTDEHHMSEVCDEHPDLVHMLTKDDVSWAKAAGRSEREWQGFFKWYFLNGGKFPLGFLCRRIPYYLRNGQLMKWLLPDLLRRRIQWRPSRD